MNKQLIQDHNIKLAADRVAKVWAYKPAKYDSEKGTLVYETYSDKKLDAQEALRHVLFVNGLCELAYDLKITSHFGTITIELPEAK